MGNKLEEFEKKFRVLRPNEMDFPKYEKKNTIHLKVKNVINKDKAKSENYGVKSIHLLKSGNILVAMDYVDRQLCTINNILTIYNIPDLKQVKKYTFPKDEEEDDDSLYSIANAIQLKNGNILVIRDKFYEFDEENIDDGPKRNSEKLKYSDIRTNVFEFLDPLSRKRKIINKNLTEFENKVLVEAIDGKILCSQREGHEILGLDSVKLEENLISLLEDNWYLDIIFPSEFYPEHLYVCKNSRQSGNKRLSEFDAYDLKDFCNGKKKKSLIYNMKISLSENVYGCCEYDKKYLLFDTFNKGIYVFDLETKTKVAVSNMTYKIDSLGADFRDFGYGKMIKLEDGQLVRWYRFLRVVDIMEAKEDSNVDVDSTIYFVKKDNYIITAYSKGYVVVTQIYD